MSTASRPTGTVALMIAALNLGSGTEKDEGRNIIELLPFWTLFDGEILLFVLNSSWQG